MKTARSVFPIRASLKPLLAALLTGFVACGALAQSTNLFTGGNGTDPFPLDEYPGFNGVDTAGGWLTPWVNTFNTVGNGATPVYNDTVINTNPLNGGGNYLSFVGGAASNPGGVNSINRQFSITNGIDASYPYTLEWDYRLDYITNGNKLEAPDSTTFGNRSDQIQFGSANSASQGDAPGTFFIKVIGATTSNSPGIAPRLWSFLDGSSVATSPSGIGAIFVNATNMPLVTNCVYHFKVNVSPFDRLWDGYVTNVTLNALYGTNGYSTYATYHNHLHGQRFSDTTSYSNYNYFIMGIRLKSSNQTNVNSFDNFKFYQIPGPQSWVPSVTQVTPAKAQSFYPYQSNIVFSVIDASGATLPAARIHMSLNGVDVSAGLAFSGTDADTNRLVTYSGTLQDNVSYYGGVGVTDSLNNVTTNTFFFDTFDTNVVTLIEAENYNFDPTLASCDPYGYQTDIQTDRYIQNWVYGGVTNIGQPTAGPYNITNSYFMRPADAETDYHMDTPTSPLALFRYCDGTQIRSATADDYSRGSLLNLGLTEYWLCFVGTNGWWNYTYQFPPGNYYAFLRGGAFKFPFTFNLEQVIGDYTVPNSNTNLLGTFTIPPAGRSQVFHNWPLVAPSGSTNVLSLSGKTTLRIHCLTGDQDVQDNSQLNYLVFLPASVGPINLLNPGRSGSTTSFSFNTVGGASYVVQYKNNLTDPSWTTLQTTNGTGGQVTIHDTYGGSQRFYRVHSP